MQINTKSDPIFIFFSLLMQAILLGYINDNINAIINAVYDSN